MEEMVKKIVGKNIQKQKRSAAFAEERFYTVITWRIIFIIYIQKKTELRVEGIEDGGFHAETASNYVSARERSNYPCTEW